MHQNPSSSTAIGMDAGKLSGCPICLSRCGKLPNPGDEIILMSFMAGATGIVSRVDPGFPFNPGTFLIRLPTDRENVEMIIDPTRDLYANLPLPAIPPWAPPLSLRDAGELDGAIISFCHRCTAKRKWLWVQEAFFGLIGFVWERRFPLTPEELWGVLRAHGVPDRERGRCQRLFKEGLELLTVVRGRKPVKGKRVKALTY
jgi:hypothetical protein